MHRGVRQADEREPERSLHAPHKLRDQQAQRQLSGERGRGRGGRRLEALAPLVHGLAREREGRGQGRDALAAHGGHVGQSAHVRAAHAHARVRGHVFQGGRPRPSAAAPAAGGGGRRAGRRRRGQGAQRGRLARIRDPRHRRHDRLVAQTVAHRDQPPAQLRDRLAAGPGDQIARHLPGEPMRAGRARGGGGSDL